MDEITSRRKIIIILGALLVVALLILAGLLFYFFHTKNNQPYSQRIKVDPEVLEKSVLAPSLGKKTTQEELTKQEKNLSAPSLSKPVIQTSPATNTAATDQMKKQSENILKNLGAPSLR